MSAGSKARASEQIARLAGEGLDVVSFWRESTVELSRAVPHDWFPCWFTLDPASLLITSHYNAEIAQLDPAVFHNEYEQDDFNKLAEVAVAQRPATTLRQATNGQPERSIRYRELLRSYGMEQELTAAFRTKEGVAWGGVTLYRESGRTEFDEEELRFLLEVAPYLAHGARRGLLIAEVSDQPDGPDAPGLLVLDSDGTIDSMTPGVEQWLADLPDGDYAGKGTLPSAVLAVAGRAMRTASGVDRPGDIALARVLSRSGRWIVLHGAALVADGRRRAAVIVEPAHPARIAPLLMSAYGLTEREQEVTQLVLQGHSTADIAKRLFLSPHTIQQHLKGIFDKTGVRSRRELMGNVFFAYYEPRVRDNEQRTTIGQPVRGDPYDPRVADR